MAIQGMGAYGAERERFNQGSIPRHALPGRGQARPGDARRGLAGHGMAGLGKAGQSSRLPRFSIHGGQMEAGEHADNKAFWEWIDDGPTDDEKEAARHFDLYGHAERHWRE